MDLSVKPILSINEISLSEDDLVSNGAHFNSAKSIATYNGVKYYYSSTGKYIGLNDGEICISDDVVITPLKYPTIITIEDKYLVPGLIMSRSGDEILPIISSEKSSIYDVVLEKEESISENVLE